MRKIGMLMLVVAVALATGCRKKAQEQAEEDDRLILEYIATNNLTAIKDASGLYYVIDQQGNGASCNSSSDVRVAYTGYYLDGVIFDGSDQQGISFNLGGVIEGWTIGIPYFKEGGTGQLLIPSALGYGTGGQGSIPGNTVLVFDIELIEVL
jgi:FKBP-type peptidyl-prolyl cis-trans isomerase FkpA